MKQITLDWNTYQEEIKKSYRNGYFEGERKSISTATTMIKHKAIIEYFDPCEGEPEQHWKDFIESIGEKIDWKNWEYIKGA